MVAGIAHEVRNPLGGVQIYTELLANDPNLTTSQRERVQKVLLEIHRLGEIVDEFLAYARPQTPERSVVDPAETVQETVDLLAGMLAEREVEVRQLAPEQRTRILVDPGQLRQILLNLVRNAVEASPRGGTVQVAWDRQGTSVVIIVEDQGPGVPLERREQVFEPFFTTKSSGAGLGLSIVRHLTEQNGGQVSLDRAQGGGCRFTVRLEMAKEDSVG
jgi:signal transduction histidine kinase